MAKKQIVYASEKKAKQRNLTVRERQLYSICAIPLIYTFIFMYIPMFGVMIAFKDYKFNLGVFGSEWVGFKNFEFFLKSDVFVQLVRNTVCNNLLFIVFGTIAAIIVALLLFEVTSRRSTKVYQTLIITPHFISWVIGAYIVYAILNIEYGYLNQILAVFGIGPIDWYSKPKVWPIILTIVSVWKMFGMDSIIYYAALMGVDSSLFEAAEVDGAGKLRKVWSITIPSLIPIIVILTIMKIGGIFRADFGLFYSVTQDGANGNLYETTNVFDTYIFRTFRSSNTGNAYGLSAAAGLFQSVVGMVLVIATNYLTKKVDKDLALF